MSSEDIHTEATVVDNQGSGDQADTQSPVDRNQTEVSVMDRASETQSTSTATATLLQLHNGTFSDTHFDRREPFTDENTRSDPGRTCGTGEGRPTYTRVWENGPYDSRNTANFPDSMNMYSHINMQNTIVGLTNAIGNLQQEQINMHTRQDDITGTLGQVLSVLQGLRDGTGSASSTSYHNMVQNTGFPQSAINNSASMYSESMGDKHFTNQNCGQAAELQTDPTQNVSSADRHYGYRNHRCEDRHSRDENVGSVDRHYGYRNYGSEDRHSRDNNISSVDRHYGYRNYRHEDRHSGSRRESSIDRHHGSNHGTTAQVTSQGDQFTPYNETELSPTEENTESRYGSVTEDTGNAVNLANRSQRYNGQRDDEGRPSVTFSDTYRYDRGIPRGDYCEYDRPLEAHGSNSVPRDQDGYRARSGRRFSSPETYGWKMPPYNGKEEWKVWINRFEAIADRRNWSEEVKLDNLLPKLQGKADDFVFTQLSKDTLSCYGELVKELNSRFRVVETKKTFASKFSQRVQKEGETAEEYAADLKRLYAKAYKNRDNRTKREDLVRRFLDGMRDNEARFEIEFHKEPDDIDEAVYHAVNFVQTRRRSSTDTHDGKRLKRYVRRTNPEYDCSSEGEAPYESDEDEEKACRIPAKTDKPQARKTNKPDQPMQKGNTAAAGKDDSMKMLTDLVQTLVSQLKNQSTTTDGKKSHQQGNAGFSGRNKIRCYGCLEFGHIIRDCPKTNRSGSQSDRGRGKSSPPQGQPQPGSSLN